MSDYMRPGMPKSDPSLLRLNLVGPMRALTLDNTSVLPPGRKTRGLLAILAMAGRRPVLRGKLAELLWSRRSEEQARASLRQEIHRLLDALTPLGASVISVERHSLALRPGLTAVDAERLLNANVNQIIAQASAQAGAEAISLASIQASGALPPLDGVLLEELNGTDPALDLWLASERRRMREHASALFEAALQRSSEPMATIGICRQLLLIDPLHEFAWRETIRMQLQLGDRGGALQSADRCAALFASVSSGEPGPETRRVLSDLRAGVITPTLDEEPAAAAPDALASDAADASLSEDDAVVSMARRRLPSRVVATLAVLPPLDLDANAPDKLAPVLTEELTASLAVQPMLAVVSGSALAQSLAQGRDDALLRRNLGLDYVLDGTILRGRSRIRIILRLLDLRLQGLVVWANRFDCDPSDAMLMLDDVVAKVTARLPWELMVIESRRVMARPVAELNATQLSLRAVGLMMRTDRAANDKAGELLQRAASLDPEHPFSIHVESMRHLIRARQLWGDMENESASAETIIGKALAATRPEASDIAAAGLIHGQLLGDPNFGLALIDRALANVPHLGIGLVFAAELLVRIGELDKAQMRFDRYKHLTPLHPLHALLDGIAVTIALLQGRMQDAADLGRQLAELSPGLLDPAVCCLSAFGHLGLRTEAARLRARIEGLAPGIGAAALVGQMGLLRAQDRDVIARGLHAAGMTDSPSSEPVGVRVAT